MKLSNVSTLGSEYPFKGWFALEGSKLQFHDEIPQNVTCAMIARTSGPSLSQPECKFCLAAGVIGIGRASVVRRNGTSYMRQIQGQQATGS